MAVSENVVENVIENVVENEAGILNILMKDNHLSARRIAQKIKLTERTVQRYLKALQNKGTIKRVGGDKGGHWQIVKPKNNEK